MSGGPHIAHPGIRDREEFLVDGCPRCREYVDDLGLHFDPQRFRDFWEHMTRVEWDDADHYHSESDKELGRRLYLVSLSFERAFGLHPRMIGPTLLHQLAEGFGLPHLDPETGSTFIEVTDPRD